MSSSIDQRIVAMRFDNQQFEKHARQSMKTIQELREGLNLDGVADSFSMVGKAASESLNFKDTTKTLNTFSKGLTGMGRIAKRVFSASTFPLKMLSNGLRELSSYTRMVLGIDIASSLVNAGKKVVQAFTIEPIKAGWSEYELKMDSIKTIMTGTVKTYKDAMKALDGDWEYSEAEHLEYVKDHLERLNKYADDTIYSFQNMTNNIGKFTNAGVDLDTATRAMMGISNAAAHAGQGAQQASSAMYNLSQALGMGYLGTRDWLSIENANMATLQFKQTLVDMGVALGSLEKQGDKVFVKGSKNVEVTAENLRDTLSEKWVNKDVLLAALEIYSGDYIEEDAEKVAALYHLTRDEALAMIHLGMEAKEAATQVRTFSKMWDALKEAAQSGWAMSWEYIFGDMKEATELWTTLNDRFSAILDAQAEERNSILRKWRGMQKNEEGEWEKIEGAEDGRTILLEGVYSLLDGIQLLTGSVGTAWTNVFGLFTSENLMNLTKGFTSFANKFKSWLGTTANADSRISKITKTFQGFFSIFKMAGTSLKGVFDTVIKTLHLDKALDLVIDVSSQLGDWLTYLSESLTQFWSDISSSKIVTGLSTFFNDLWSSVSNFFTVKNTDTGNTGFTSWLQSTWASLEEIWGEIQGSDIYKGLSGFFDQVYDFFFEKKQPKPNLPANKIVPVAFGVDEVYDNVSGKTGFQEMLESIALSIQQAWGNVNKTLGPIAFDIGQFLSDTWSWIVAQFTPTTTTNDKGEEVEGDSPVVKFLNDISSKIQQAWTDVSGWEGWTAIGQFLSDTWSWIVAQFTPTTTTNDKGEEVEGDSPVVTLIKNVKDAVQEAWQEITSWSGWAAIGEFLSDTWSWILSNFSGGTTNTTGKIALPKNALLTAIGLVARDFNFQKAPSEIQQNKFLEFFQNLTSTISEFVANVKDWNGWQDIGGFLTTVFEGIGSAFESFKQVSGITTMESLGQAMASVLDALSKVIAAISKFVVAGADIINGKGSTEDIITLVEGIAAIIGAIAAKVWLANATGTAGGGAIKALVTTLAKITIIIGWISLIGLAMWGLEEALEGIFGEEAVKSIPDKIKNFGQIFVAIAQTIGEVLGSIWGGMQGGNLTATSENMVKAMDIVAEITDDDVHRLTTVMDAFKAIGDNLPNNPGLFSEWFGGEMSLGKFGENIGQLGDGLRQFSISFKDVSIDQDTFDMIPMWTAVLTALSEDLPDDPGVLGKWFGHKMTLGEFGDNMSQLGSGMSAFSGFIDEIPDFTKVTEAINAISALVHAATTIAMMDEISGGKWDSWNYVYQMFQLIGGMNNQLSRYTDQSFSDDFEPLISFAEAFNADVAEAAESITIEPLLEAISEQLNGGQKDLISDAVKGLFDVSEWQKELESQLKGIQLTITTANISYADGEEGSDVNGLGLADGTSYKEGFTAGISGLSQAILYQIPTRPVIRPIVDLSNVRAAGATIRDIFSYTPKINLGGSSVTQSSPITITKTPTDGRLNGSTNTDLHNALNGVNSKLDEVVGAISGMNVTLDSGALVGGIASKMDQALGSRAAKAYRRGG